MSTLQGEGWEGRVIGLPSHHPLILSMQSKLLQLLLLERMQWLQCIRLEARWDQSSGWKQKADYPKPIFLSFNSACGNTTETCVGFQNSNSDKIGQNFSIM